VEERFGDAALLQRIAAEIDAFSGVVGLYAKNLATGETVGYRPDAVMPTASTIKVCVLAELYRQSDAEVVNLDDRLPVTQADWSGGSGGLKEFVPNLRPTLGDLARMMIVVSDNVATGMLVRLLGKDRINATMRAWGLSRTELIWNMELGGDTREYALSTPRELGRLMELVATDGIVSPQACAAMRDHLARQQYRDQIPRYLPFNPYAEDLRLEQPIAVMNKSGFYLGVRVDAAIVRTPEATFVIATMTEESRDRSFRPEHEGNLLNASVARLVFDAWVGPLPPSQHASPEGYLSLAQRTALLR
jgi:beta-lactamase class A